jgi:YVTN family beta-propeller protein
VYVPDTSAGHVEVIDAATRQVVRRIAAGRMPQQVVPSWDLKTLWVTETDGLMAINARTGVKGRTVPVDDPSDLYFSADGRQALVPLAHRGRIEVRAPHTLRSRSTINVPCQGLTRGDFSASGATLVIGCRTSARLERVDVQRHRVTATLRLPSGARPKDVRLSPDGSTFYVADAHHGGVWLVDALRFRMTGFIRTGKGAHGLYPSRDSSLLYVANSGERTVSLISFAGRRLVGVWPVPAAPDMGGVSADGRLLWLSGHDADAVFAISTSTGSVVSRLQTGAGPHGVTVYPQPGRFSLGHTGLYR